VRVGMGVGVGVGGASERREGHGLMYNVGLALKPAIGLSSWAGSVGLRDEAGMMQGSKSKESSRDDINTTRVSLIILQLPGMYSCARPGCL